MKSRKKVQYTQSIVETISSALTLLNKKDRKKFHFFIILQVIVNILDFIALFLVIVIVTVSGEKITTVQGKGTINTLISKIGINPNINEFSILWLTLATLLVLIFKTVLNMLITRKTLKMLAKQSNKLSVETLESFINNKIQMDQEVNMSETIYTLSTGIPRIIFSILGSFSALVADITLLIFLIFGLFLYNFEITLITLFILGTTVLISHVIISKRIYNLGIASNTNDLAANSIILGYLRNKKEIFVKGNSSRLIEIYSKKRFEHLKSSSDLMYLQNSSRYVIDLAVPITSFSLLGIQLLSASNFQGSLSLAVFLVAATRIAPALIKLQSNLIVMKSVSGETHTIKKWFLALQQAKHTDLYENLKQPPKHSDYSLIFKNVNFKYKNEDLFELKNINLEINPGEVAFITGSSGTGKSTIVDLACGLLKQNSGEILLANYSPQITLNLNQGKFAYVPQDPMILSGTIKENILLGSPSETASDEKLWNVLGQVYLEKYVKKLGKGLDTQVGEFGVAMSGGQRQRLGLARALISEPEFLILDEITSALDQESENAIKNLLVSFKGKKTVLVISHSANFREIADKVFLLKNGMLIQT